MTLTAFIGMMLVLISLYTCGYSAKALCRTLKLGRDPRPLTLAIFSTLAYAVLNFFWVLGGYSEQIEPTFKVTWIIVHFSLLTCLLWHIRITTRYRGK